MSGAAVPSAVPSCGSVLPIGSSLEDRDGAYPTVRVTTAVMRTSSWLAGQSTLGVTLTLIDGAVVSATRTTDAQDAEFELESVAVKVTGVSPIGSTPGALFDVAGAASQL